MPQPDKKNEGTKESIINVTVAFLDERVESLKVPGRCLGQQLYDLVIGKLGSFEYQYFDLAFLDVEGNHCWLDHKKALFKTLRTSGHGSLEFVFSVKYYVPHPNLIVDEHTRYLFALQLKRDFFNGLLHSNRNTSLLLAAFIVQSELGDYMETECKSYAYLKKHHLLRSAPDSYLMRVMELHQTLVGLTKEEADYRLLDAARKVELYGVRLHPVKDAADQSFNLAVTHAGVLVFQHFSRVNTYIWSKIRKLSFNRHKFLIKLHTGDQDYLRDTVEYTFPTRNGCKNFWRKCIEQHAFFRSVTSLFPTNGSNGRPATGLLDSFRSNSLSSVRRLRRSASCGATGPADSLHSSVSRTSDGPSSSSQASQLSTPVRRLARIRQHAASFKLFGRTNKRPLEELQSPCLLSDAKPAWALPEHPYTLPRQSTPSSKPVGVTKLLSNCPNPTAEHFQLLRLSFTSLLPETNSAIDTGHTTPTASRMRTLERMRERAVSTPSIHQPELPKRKRSCHAFVPRQFNPLGSSTLPGNRFSSQVSDVVLDLSASRTFPKRPDLDEAARQLHRKDTSEVNNVHDGAMTPSPTTSTKVYRLNGYQLHRTPSSSCSLASDMSPTPLSENETTLNDIGGLTSPRDPRESWPDACGDNEDSWSMSSREPVRSVLAPPKTLNRICSPQLAFRSTMDDTVPPGSQLAGVVESSVAVVSSPSEPATSGMIVEDATSKRISDYDNLAMDESESVPLDDSPPQSNTRCTDRGSNKAERTPAVTKKHTYRSNSVSHMDELEATEMRDESLTLVEPEVPETEHVHACDPSAAPERVCESRSEMDGVYFSDSESRGTPHHGASYGHTEDLPESLADAVSLGAISMMTGISCYDDLPDDEGSTDSDADRPSGPKSDILGPVLRNRLKGCTSLKLLGRSYWGPSSTSTSSSSSPTAPAPRSALINTSDGEKSGKRARSGVQRTKSEPFCVSTSRPSGSSREGKQILRPKRRRKPIKSRDNVRPRKPDAELEKQRATELEFRRHFLKQAAQSEEIYQRDLQFLASVPLELAIASQTSELIDWLKQRMLPLLTPLVERNAELLDRLRTELRRSESLASSVPLDDRQQPLSKQDRTESGDILTNIFDANLARVEPGDTVQSDSDNSASIGPSDLAGPGAAGSSESTTYSVLQAGAESYPQSAPDSDRLHSGTACSTKTGFIDLRSFDKVFASYLDLLEPYTTWITENSTLIAELWYLAYSDLLTVPTPNSSIPHPVLEPDGMEDTRSSRSPPVRTTISTRAPSKCVSRARSESAVDRSVRRALSRFCATPGIVSHQYASDPIAVRAVWYRVESRLNCLMPLPVYLLRPGRHFRQYCVLFGSLLTKYAPSHPDLTACKAVFTRFVQLARSVYAAYRHAEQIVLILQSARSVLPMFGFLALLPTASIHSTCIIGSTGETDLPVPRRTTETGTEVTLPPLTNYRPSSPAIWPSVTSADAFRFHLQYMPGLRRIGWLKKYSRRGFQPRMVFLFDDRMVFTSRIRGTPFLFLKIHGIISLNCAYVIKEHLNLPAINNSVSEAENVSSFAVVAVVDTGTDDQAHVSGTVGDSPNSQGRSPASRNPRRSRSRSKSCARRKFRRKLLFCATDEVSRDAWVTDISRLIAQSVDTNASGTVDLEHNSIDYKLPPGVFRFRDPDLSEWVRNELVQHQPGPRPSSRTGSPLCVHRVNSLTRSPATLADEVPGCLTDTLLTVCWHRHLGVTHTQLLNTNDCEMSSFLLRKFKHGTGWQKLWAVLSDLSLLFYKTPEDTQPLARLALLGYTVELLDNITPVAVTTGPSSAPGKRPGLSKLSASVLQLSHGSKQYHLRAETQEILISWFHVFSAILTGTQSTGRSSTSIQWNDLPLRMPKSLSSRCGSAELVYTCNSSISCRGRGSPL